MRYFRFLRADFFLFIFRCHIGFFKETQCETTILQAFFNFYCVSIAYLFRISTSCGIPRLAQSGGIIILLCVPVFAVKDLPHLVSFPVWCPPASGPSCAFYFPSSIQPSAFPRHPHSDTKYTICHPAPWGLPRASLLAFSPSRWKAAHWTS